MGAVCCCCRPTPPPEDPSPPTPFIDPEETPPPPEDLGTPEERERAFNTVLDTEKNKILIREHIVKLARRTLACRAAFENVGKLLASFDNQNFSTTDGRAIPELRPGWDELRKVWHIISTLLVPCSITSIQHYDTLLLVSRSEAVVVKAVCDGKQVLLFVNSIYCCVPKRNSFRRIRLYRDGSEAPERPEDVDR